MNKIDENESLDGFSNDNEETLEHSAAEAIPVPPIVGNVVFYVTSTMMHLPSMNGLFGGKVSDDVDHHIQNFIKVFRPLKMNNIFQESLRLRLFPFSLIGEATLA